MIGRCSIRATALATALFATAACGGDSGPSGPPPVGSVEVTPATASLGVGDTQQLTATVRDEAGNTLTGRTVTWSSSAAAIASVDAAGLATAVGPGTATITATAGGKSGSAEVTVAPVAFNPTADTNVEGSKSYASITIPAGVTVTVTGQATLSSSGPIDIEGDLKGDCVELSLVGEGDVTIAGDVSNACSGDAGDSPPELKIVGDGNLTLGAGTLASSGDVEIQNDPTLGDADFPTVAGAPIFAAGIEPQANGALCIVAGRSFMADPPRDGSDGQDGTAGKDGRTWTLSCRGSLDVQGAVAVVGQGGGNGGDGSHTSASSAQAKGGDGGDGGRIRVRATGDISFSGGGNSIASGDGGDGGSAVATATSDATAAKAPPAAATGGDGGRPGLIEVRANGSISIDAGSLTLRVGHGGAGGAATATGADGVDAAARGDAAQGGGDATATAGAGGGTPDKQLASSGAVTGLAGVSVQGGDAGAGGKATAHVGNGGDGDDAHPPGAAAGAIAAHGGDGGTADLRDQNDALIGAGGAGGDAVFESGTGGNGAPRCPDDPGGDGGKGASASGGPGSGGGGAPAGADGAQTVSAVGNGGNGGDGKGPGAAGAAGADGIVPAAAHAGSFTPGAPGNACAPPPQNGTYDVQITVQSDPSNHEPFIGMPTVQTLDIVVAGDQITVTGPSPWVPLTGMFDPATGAFTATGTGTFAGGQYPDIHLMQTGTIMCPSGPGSCTLTDAMTGTNFPPEFPQDIVYRIMGTQRPVN